MAEIVRLANRYETPLVGRGAGTGLSGGAIARNGGIVIAFSRMNRILEVDAANLRAVVQPGVVNLDLSRAVEHLGLYFAPDPSSQRSCTIGGNVSENSGGPHTLAYGVTSNHVTGMELVLPEGEIVRIGGKTIETPGYDLDGLLVGSEGTLALVTEITVRLTRKPEAVKTLLAVYDTLDDTTETVVDITVRAITPAACEMLDGFTLARSRGLRTCRLPQGLRRGAADRSRRPHRSRRSAGRRDHRGLPPASMRGKCASRATTASAISCGRAERTHSALSAGSRPCITCRTASSRARACRKRCAASRKSAANTTCKSATFFTPATAIFIRSSCLTSAIREQFKRVIAAGMEIMKHCVAVGGALTGEHGVGMEKNELMPLMFTPEDLDLMRRVRAAFNPAGRLNPGKVLPLGKGVRRNSRATDAGFLDSSRMSHPAQASVTRLEEIVGGANVLTDPR